MGSLRVVLGAGLPPWPGDDEVSDGEVPQRVGRA
jgi:hypothetical protein